MPCRFLTKTRISVKVSPEVLYQMKEATVASYNCAAASHNFLLDDDSSLPFQVQNLQATVDDKELYVGVAVPEVLREPSDPQGGFFTFLETEMRFSAQ